MLRIIVFALVVLVIGVHARTCRVVCEDEPENTTVLSPNSTSAAASQCVAPTLVQTDINPYNTLRDYQFYVGQFGATRVTNETLLTDVWKLVRACVSAEGGEFPQKQSDGRFYIELPLDGLRRIRPLKLYGALISHSGYEGWTSFALALVRTGAYANLTPVLDDATFNTVLNLLAKAFQDQRMNADLYFALSYCDTHLRVSWSGTKRF